LERLYRGKYPPKLGSEKLRLFAGTSDEVKIALVNISAGGGVEKK